MCSRFKLFKLGELPPSCVATLHNPYNPSTAFLQLICALLHALSLPTIHPLYTFVFPLCCLCSFLVHPPPICAITVPSPHMPLCPSAQPNPSGMPQNFNSVKLQCSLCTPHGIPVLRPSLAPLCLCDPP